MGRGIDAMMEESLEEEYSKMNEIESARILVERDEWRGMMLDTVHLFEETGLTPQTLRDLADELAGALKVITEDSRFLKCFTSDKDDTLFDRIDNALARYDAVNDNQQEGK